MSYSHADRSDALPVIKALEDAGFNVWWDGLIKGGVHAAQETADVLERARAVLVLWSKNSAKSHWVQDEATRGRDRGCLVPVSIDGHEPPLGFGQFQFIDISGKKNDPGSPEMQKVLHAVSALHEDTVSPVQIASPGAAQTPLIARRNLIIGGTATVLAGGTIAAWAGGLFDGKSQPSSIAVLPFANLSRDPEQVYFSDGLASEIRSELSRNPLLQIVGQTSSNSFRDKQDDAKSIAKKLGVSFLLDGNVQKAAGQIKITTDLIDGRTGLSKWAETFERPIADVFAVQEEIAAAVASAMSVAMSTNGKSGDSHKNGGTTNIAAFDAYLRGRDLFELHIDETSERAALAKFEESIQIDPEYAAPRAARARALAVIANQYVGSDERFRLYDEAAEEATRATKIAPEFAAGFNALGYALFYGKLDVQGARTPYDQAYALAKSDVDVFSRYAIYCARTGRFSEAYKAIDQASKLDPLNASIFRSMGTIKYAGKEYDEAIAAGRRALEINPERNSVHGDIGDSYLMLGQLGKARQEYELEKNSLITLTGKAILEHREGNRAEAQKNFDGLVADHGDNGLYQQAEVLAQWGETDRVFAVLSDAQKLRDSGLIYLLHDPFLDPVRDDDRFNDLLLQLGFL
ncbi:MAG: TIR domain-containing protein [Parasphingorhabdus sp.]